MKVYDLSLNYDAKGMVFPGTPPIAKEVFATAREHGFNMSMVTVNPHTGTHTDAPFHFVDEGRKLAEVDINKYVGPCHIVDARTKPERADITVEDVKPFEGVIRQKKRVLFMTDWDRHEGTDKYYEDYPKISLPLAEYLVELGVVLVGVEAPSLNPPLMAEVHRALLGGNVAVVEGLTNLNQIYGKEVIFCAPPVKFVEMDGFPTRAFAIEL